jgi:cytoskeleton protein RodZ
MIEKVKEQEEQQQQPKTVIPGPGQILKQARDRANLSSQDIADRMKLKKTLIEDIEQDNYDVNISLTFIRGYLKLYAKHVHVEELEILNAFESLSTQNKEPAKLQSFSRRMANQANDDKLMIVTYFIVAAVIALVVIWWFQQSSTDVTSFTSTNDFPGAVNQNDTKQDVIAEDVLHLEETSPSDAKTLIPVSQILDLPVDVSAVTTSAIDLSQEIIARELVDPFIAKEVADDKNKQAALTNILDTMATESAAPVELIFEFSGDCWMNLADATGENIAYGVKVNGRIMPVTGIPPFVVTLGAPEVVKIRYEGEPLDMSFLPSGRIAKFNLPLSE